MSLRKKTRVFEGVPCSRCKNTVRYVSTHSCIVCQQNSRERRRQEDNYDARTKRRVNAVSDTVGFDVQLSIKYLYRRSFVNET